MRRYQRFLADVVLDDGAQVTAYTPNTGSMSQCAEPGAVVLLSKTDNPRRRLGWTWELVAVNGFWVDINTHRANRVVEEALQEGRIVSLTDHIIRAEYPYANSRFDFMLQGVTEKVLLEVKNVTLCCAREVACFPDAITLRGQKHLRDLMYAAAHGWRAVVLFLVQRGEASAFRAAGEVDPEYARLLRQVASAGVEIRAYRTVTTATQTRLTQSLEVRF